MLTIAYLAATLPPPSAAPIGVLADDARTPQQRLLDRRFTVPGISMLIRGMDTSRDGRVGPTDTGSTEPPARGRTRCAAILRGLLAPVTSRLQSLRVLSIDFASAPIEIDVTDEELAGQLWSNR